MTGCLSRKWLFKEAGMADDELEAELKELSKEDREETIYLLRLNRMHKVTKPFRVEIEDRAKEKNITFIEARRELINEAEQLQGKLISKTGKLLKPKLSKNVRQKLGIKNAGRPQGSKRKHIKYSKAKLYKKLEEYIREVEDPTQENAAKALGLGSAKTLKRYRETYGDKRDWRVLVKEILEAQE